MKQGKFPYLSMFTPVFAQWFWENPFEEYQKGVEEVCLRKPFDAPYPVPVHQEAITQTHLNDSGLKEIVTASDAAMDRAFTRFQSAKRMLLSGGEIWEAMRLFAAGKNVIFYRPGRPQIHIVSALDIHVEPTKGEKLLTIQHGKRRGGKLDAAVISEIGLLPYIRDQSMIFPDHEPPFTSAFDQNGVALGKPLGELLRDKEAIEQDMPEVKKLPSSKSE